MVTVTPSPAPSLGMLIPGGFFRQYQLLEQIGVGGQAVVWSAIDRDRHRVFAVKFNKILDADEINAEEIGIEAKMEKLVALHHVHILPLHEFGTEERVRFMVSPYVPGGTLAMKIKAAPLSFEEALRYGMEVASALDYLHGQGVIHRDLKASNILLDLSQHTYLADFGLARIVSTSTLAFHTGHGTPPYAPPEQVRSQEITRKSDIFSFGILLFEMLTGQLPWNGKKQLGVEQLHSDQELPDPREYVADLPPLLTDVLRRITSANPDLRPRSATEAMRMIYYVFNVPFKPVAEGFEYDESAARAQDAEQLLTNGVAEWESSREEFNIGLTKFALINLERKKLDTNGFSRFMLSQALTYGYEDDRWWEAVADPRKRLSISANLLRKENEVIAGRVLAHLVSDAEFLKSARALPETMAKSFLGVGTRTNDPVLRQQIFTGLRTLVRPRTTWTDPSLDPNQIKRLGVLALEDSEAGDATAKLIGHLRLPSAVRVILKHFDDERKVATLLLIQEVAGSLPSFVPGGVRLRLSQELMLRRLPQQPLTLVGAYLMAFLGAALGVGIQVYLTYILPDYFDLGRIATSLEWGLIVGSMLALGIFVARLMTERLQTSNVVLSVLIGTIVGSIGLNMAFLVFHVLFLLTPPRGFLITLGCAVIALSFAVGGLMPSRWIKMVLSSASVFLAIFGTWLIHVNLTSSPVELTPLFKYDYTWQLAHIALIALVAALSIGIFGNLVSLRIEDEHP